MSSQQIRTGRNIIVLNWKGSSCSVTVPFVGFCCSFLLVRYGFLLISGHKIKTVMYYSSEYYTHWWLWLLKFRTTSSHTNMPQCHPRGPFCLVWRALTLGLWPLPEATPLSALLLLEDHTLFILLDSFLFFCFPAPLFQCRMELSMDLKHSQMRGPQQVQLLTFDLRDFSSFIGDGSPSLHIKNELGWWSCSFSFKFFGAPFDKIECKVSQIHPLLGLIIFLTCVCHENMEFSQLIIMCL